VKKSNWCGFERSLWCSFNTPFHTLRRAPRAVCVSSLTLTYGQTEVFTATVTTNPPGATIPTGGTVSFVDGTATLAAKELSVGSAVFSTTGLGAGPHVFSAIHGVDAEFGGSQSGINSGPAEIATVARSGTAGFAGDGGPATPTVLHSPTGVAVDSPGDHCIVHELNNRVREVNAATGVITTVADTGVVG
jgi:Bacterial Ig-like domain (group 3)